MLELTRNWNGHNPDADALIAQFNPMSPEDFRKAPEIDAYFIQSISGNFNRVHAIKKNGITDTNPPPEDSCCQSCGKRDWLEEEYWTSKIDGANAPVWVCSNCSKRSAASRLTNLDDPQVQSPKTGFPPLDNNPQLIPLMSYVLARGIKGAKMSGGERGESQGVTIGQKYKQRITEPKFELVGNITIMGGGDNLLTMSADPDAGYTNPDEGYPRVSSVQRGRIDRNRIRAFGSDGENQR